MTEKLKACEDCGCRVYDQSAHDRICETEKLRQRLTASEQRIAELEAERDGLRCCGNCGMKTINCTRMLCKHHQGGKAVLGFWPACEWWANEK